MPAESSAQSFVAGPPVAGTRQIPGTLGHGVAIGPDYFPSGLTVAPPEDHLIVNEEWD